MEAKRLCNYCSMPEQNKALQKMGMTLSQFVAALGLDGIELLVYRNVPCEEPLAHLTWGVHLNYWPMWLAMYREDSAELSRFFSSDKALRQYYGGTSCRGWLHSIRANIKAALAERPEYLVWHIAECTTEETFTFKFAHNDLEIAAAAAEVFNLVADEIPKNVLVLFENLWWPGLRLTDSQAVHSFFSQIKRQNVGIMLDTGHLMNTNPEIRTEREGIAYILNTVKALGQDQKLIRGLHLNCSLSGEYVKNCGRCFDPAGTDIELMNHIMQIDQHRPFTDEAVQQLLNYIKPDYIVHELAYRDLNDFQTNITAQLAACGQSIPNGNKGDHWRSPDERGC